MKLMELAGHLDKELSVSDFSDVSHNGLQVEAQGPVRRVCCGVDASLEFMEQAASRKADLLICHHGLSWGDSLSRITGLNYNRLKFLLNHNMALYACHLPLDAHRRLGNNAQLSAALGLRRLRRFGWYNGVQIGFAGFLPRAMPYERFKVRVCKLLKTELRTMDFGPGLVRTVAVVSGGAADELDEAGRAGVDVFLSGEPKLSAWHLAREYGVNAVFGGHYATETFGVRALAEWLNRRFGLRAEFVDLATPY
ncbi:MAG: Nif3-like dinuclear metal center hexameric protein [Kiritimatiellia bacterium]